MIEDEYSHDDLMRDTCDMLKEALETVRELNEELDRRRAAMGFFEGLWFDFTGVLIDGRHRVIRMFK